MPAFDESLQFTVITSKKRVRYSYDGTYPKSMVSPATFLRATWNRPRAGADASRRGFSDILTSN